MSDVRPKDSDTLMRPAASCEQTSIQAGLSVTFWGVRGTLPILKNDFAKYGGNTSCVEVSCMNSALPSVIFDAGTGIADCGDAAIQKGQREFHIALSHMHYDHIIGLTRFAPLFRTDCKIAVYGASKQNVSLKSQFASFFKSPFFPIEFLDLPCQPNLTFVEIEPAASCPINGMTLSAQRLHHPQGAQAYRLQRGNASLVYATDHEHGTGIDQELIDFCKETSLFLYDSHYCEKSYQDHIGWGHSTAMHGAIIAKAARVQSFGLFHHDPLASDMHLERYLLPEALSVFERSFLCVEGSKILLESGAHSASG